MSLIPIVEIRDCYIEQLRQEPERAAVELPIVFDAVLKSGLLLASKQQLDDCCRTPLGWKQREVKIRATTLAQNNNGRMVSTPNCYGYDTCPTGKVDCSLSLFATSRLTGPACSQSKGNFRDITEAGIFGPQDCRLPVGTYPEEAERQVWTPLVAFARHITIYDRFIAAKSGIRRGFRQGLSRLFRLIATHGATRPVNIVTEVPSGADEADADLAAQKIIAIGKSAGLRDISGSVYRHKTLEHDRFLVTDQFAVSVGAGFAWLQEGRVGPHPLRAQMLSLEAEHTSLEKLDFDNSRRLTGRSFRELRNAVRNED